MADDDTWSTFVYLTFCAVIIIKIILDATAVYRVRRDLARNRAKLAELRSITDQEKGPPVEPRHGKNLFGD